MGFVDPLPAVVVSFCFLGVMIYKRINLGITLNATAVFLAFLALNIDDIPNIIQQTAGDFDAISVILAAFGIMLMSQLYKETGIINDLSESLASIVNNSKLVISVLPAIIGLLPVAGGALMSAPLVEADAERLGLKPDKKTYVNVWFRHTIFPVYPISQVLILTATLTGSTISSIIIRHIPVVIVMIIVGYFIGLRKTDPINKKTEHHRSLRSESERFVITFMPILATVLAGVTIGVPHVWIAPFIGITVLLLISRPGFEVLKKPFLNVATYGIVFATFGAFLLRNVVNAMNISEILGIFISNGGFNNLLLLTVIPAVLAFFVGSPLGAIAISFSMMEGALNFTPRHATLLYMSSYLGYVIAPTHLCLVLTADYFKCHLGGLYKYFIPSLAFTFGTVILLYLFV